MKLKRVLSYAGSTSQTGIGTLTRFPGLSIEGDNESFEDLVEIVINEPSLSVIPLWNSHLGEINRKVPLDMAFAKKIRIQELWPMRVKFELIGKKGTRLKNVKKILVVFAAKSQCSDFLKGFVTDERKSTVACYKEFLETSQFDAVLCAPGQWDKGKCILLKDDVSNSNNFTTFILLGNIDIEKCATKKHESIRKYGLPKQFTIAGVDMPLPVPTLSEEQQIFLDDLTNDANSIDDIPRIIFIYKRDAGRCGMLMESARNTLSSYPQQDGYLPEIIVKDNLGQTSRKYTDMTMSLINTEFRQLFSRDFIMHSGTHTCLYACPVLNLIIHGFDAEVVEAIVRRIITKYFELIDNGLSCTASQKKLFNKYKGAYYKKGAQFIDFQNV